MGRFDPHTQKALALARASPLQAVRTHFSAKTRFHLAERELRVALHLDSKNLTYFKDLSSTFFLGGNYPAAPCGMDQIAKVEQPAPVSFIRAICYDKLGQPKPALERLIKFFELDQDKNPDQIWQAKERARCCNASGAEKVGG